MRRLGVRLALRSRANHRVFRPGPGFLIFRFPGLLHVCSSTSVALAVLAVPLEEYFQVDGQRDVLYILDSIPDDISSGMFRVRPPPS